MPDPTTSPTAAQAAFGTAMWLVLAAIPLWWSFDETETGNRLVLWGLGLIALAFAAWRAVVTVRAFSAARRA